MRALAGDERSLLQQAKALDPQILRQVFDRYAEEVYRYVSHGLGDAGLAEDLTVEVFCHMLEAIRSGEVWSATLQGWLYRRAAELVAEHLRRLYGPETRLPDEPGSGDEVQSAAVREPVSESATLRAALGQLPVTEQQVLILKLLDGRTNAEIARILGQSEAAVRILQRRALTALHSNAKRETQDVRRRNVTCLC